jgi:hypothetical protein
MKQSVGYALVALGVFAICVSPAVPITVPGPPSTAPEPFHKCATFGAGPPFRSTMPVPAGKRLITSHVSAHSAGLVCDTALNKCFPAGTPVWSVTVRDPFAEAAIAQHFIPIGVQREPGESAGSIAMALTIDSPKELLVAADLGTLTANMAGPAINTMCVSGVLVPPP